MAGRSPREERCGLAGYEVLNTVYIVAGLIKEAAAVGTAFNTARELRQALPEFKARFNRRCCS